MIGAYYNKINYEDEECLYNVVHNVVYLENIKSHARALFQYLQKMRAIFIESPKRDDYLSSVIYTEKRKTQRGTIPQTN